MTARYQLDCTNDDCDLDASFDEYREAYRAALAHSREAGPTHVALINEPPERDAADLLTDGGTEDAAASTYVNPTGPGYHTTRLVGQSGIGISLTGTELAWPIGTSIAISERPRRLVLQPTPVDDAPVLTTTQVRCQEYQVRHVPVPLTILAALVVVDQADDPREPGGEAGGD